MSALSFSQGRAAAYLTTGRRCRGRMCLVLTDRCLTPSQAQTSSAHGYTLLTWPTSLLLLRLAGFREWGQGVGLLPSVLSKMLSKMQLLRSNHHAHDLRQPSSRIRRMDHSHHPAASAWSFLPPRVVVVVVEIVEVVVVVVVVVVVLLPWTRWLCGGGARWGAALSRKCFLRSQACRPRPTTGARPSISNLRPAALWSRETSLCSTCTTTKTTSL